MGKQMQESAQDFRITWLKNEKKSEICHN